MNPRRASIVAAVLLCSGVVLAAPRPKANPQADLALAAAGHKLFLSRCSRCHQLPRATAHTPEQWSRIVPKMARRSGLKPEQRDAVLAYLSAPGTK
ncbi:MAG: c-type cytochrome [Chthoniobacterales bacterium]